MDLETTTKEQLSFLEMLAKASTLCEMDVAIQLRKSKEKATPTIDITFFDDTSNNFTVSLYPFRTVEKNTEICNRCIELFKNPELFEYTKDRAMYGELI